MAEAAAALLRAGGRTPKVKVCCIASIAEADLAIAAGADALGLVSAMPSGPGPIADAAAATIARHVGARVTTVLLTSRQSAEAIGEQLDHIRPAIVQIVDELPTADYARLRSAHPAVAIMQVIHVRDRRSVDDAVHVAPFVDAILLDSGNPSATVKELGGTGRVHDWAVSRAIRETVSVPVFLAGGLRAGNVADAIARVQPFGVDVCSGVRVDGHLDTTAVHAFIQATRATAVVRECQERMR